MSIIINCVVHNQTGAKYASIIDLCKLLKEERDRETEESTKIYIQSLLDRLICL